MPSARPGGTTVEMPRGLLLGLCGALVVALLAVAFLVGRLTATEGETPSAAVAGPPEAASAPATVEPPATSPPEVVTRAAGRASEPLPDEWRALAVAPAGAEPAAAPDERAAVVAYFDQVDRLEDSFQRWSDPQQLAMQLVQQTAGGDQSGLDELLAAVRRSRQSLQDVVPPEPCREHHAESLALVDAALGLLGRLGPALAGQDFGGLQALAGVGQDLEARAKRLQELEDGLRKRYGLPANTR